MVVVPETAPLWLTSLALLAMGWLAHRHIEAVDRDTGLEVIRYMGVMGGAPGAVGLPLLALVPASATRFSDPQLLGMVLTVIVVSVGLSHVGWDLLGPPATE